MAQSNGSGPGLVVDQSLLLGAEVEDHHLAPPEIEIECQDHLETPREGAADPFTDAGKRRPPLPLLHLRHTKRHTVPPRSTPPRPPTPFHPFRPPPLSATPFHPFRPPPLSATHHPQPTSTHRTQAHAQAHTHTHTHTRARARAGAALAKLGKSMASMGGLLPPLAPVEPPTTETNLDWEIKVSLRPGLHHHPVPDPEPSPDHNTNRDPNPDPNLTLTLT